MTRVTAAPPWMLSLQSLHANNVDELKAHLSSFGEEFLFRGQTGQYNLPNGSPNLTSSFVRKGCIPPLMLKWIFYTNELLRRGGFKNSRPDDLPFTQGLLQHYGWRSFFVDLSSAPAVAAWFACHRFQANSGWNFCENSFEEPVMVSALRASYQPLDGLGHLYVLSKGALKDHGHELVSLEHDLTTDCPSRFQTQKAWLAGIYREQRHLDPATIVAHIEAPALAFSALASEAGFNTTDDVFPNPEKDKLLANILSLPRSLMDVPGAHFPCYQRGLEIPEYQDSFVKHLPPTTALYAPFWISDLEPSNDREIWFHVPEETFYGHMPLGPPFQRLGAFLQQNDIVNVESKQLISYPPFAGSLTYQKGISIRATGNQTFDVCGIAVDYQSDRLIGGGVSSGYNYELVDGLLIRRPSPTDCACDDPARHEHHLRALAVLDDMLISGKQDRQGQIIAAAYLEAAIHSWSEKKIHRACRELLIAGICTCLAAFSLDAVFWAAAWSTLLDA